MYIDSHCHFDFTEFDVHRERIWRNCQALGVRQLVIPGVNPAQWQHAATMSSSFTGIYFGVGLHPWWGNECVSNEELFSQLISAAEQMGCVAIGECGLDAFIDIPMLKQQAILEVHLRAAIATQLPVIIHCRNAHTELLLALKKYKLKKGGVIHAFSGSLQLAQQYWALGFYLGIGGTITYARANKTRTAVAQLPLAALVLETDAPDMPLSGKQGSPNSPESIPLIAQVLAELRGESIEKIATQTTQNARALFGI